MKKSINYSIVAALSAAVLALSSCSKDDELPKIDGYNNSNEVASANLVAHWTFDDGNNERISNTAPSNTFGTVGSTTGKIGKALQLTKGVLVYPSIANINSPNSLNNFTVSMWVNVKGNKKTADEGFTAFFSLTPSGVTDIWGDIVAAAETGRHLPSSDTLELKNLLNTHPVGGGNSLQDNIALKNGDKGAYFMGANRWAHYVMRWDGTTHQFHIFADAQDVGGYTDRGSTGVLIMATPVKPVFGSLASSDIGFTGAPAQQSWNPWATASIDDVRIYNTALTNAEITALFNLGTAGR
ncbi:MAG: LamG-like jellyroll fold domain-containing protein [Bacteroidota bacterium]